MGGNRDFAPFWRTARILRLGPEIGRIVGGSDGKDAIMFGKSNARKAAEQAQELENRKTRARLAARIQSMGGSHGEALRQSLRDHQRAEARVICYRVGSAMFDQVDSTSCRIVDQSYSGLRVIFNSEVECPDEFALTIPTLRFIGIVRTHWRNGREAGVSIVRWSDAA